MPITPGEGYAWYLATAAILEGETAFEVHDAILAGTEYEVDPWHNSIWFQYENWDWDNVGISWLRQKMYVNPWVGRLQVAKEAAT